MSRPMLPICAAYILGIVSAKYSGEGATMPLIVSCAVALTAGVLYFSIMSKGKRRTVFLTVWLLLPGFTWLGFYRTVETDIKTPLKTVLLRSTDSVVTGTIEYISLRPDGYAITVTASTAHIGHVSYKSNKIMISSKYHIKEDYHVGDLVCASGKLYPCEPATNPGQFDSDRYYSVRGIDARLYADDVLIIGKSGLGYFVNDFAFQIRKRLSQGIYSVLPATEAGTLNAILTGDRGMLDEDVKALYAEGGIAHILSISSLHVSLLGMGLFRLLMKLIKNLRISVGVTVMIMILYGVLTGFPVSTCRAIIMITVSLAGKLLWRGYDLPSSAGVAALVLLIGQPNYLFDSGFRLSFLAVIAIYAAGRLSDVMEVKSEVLKSLYMSGCVQLFTMPVLMNSYYCLSPYSILVNMLILPLMSILLVTGFCAGIIGGSRFVGIGRLAAGPVYYILKLYEKICELEKILPYSRIVTGAPNPYLTVVYYVLLVISIVMCVEGELKKNRRTGMNPNIAFLLLVPAIVCLLIHPGRPELYCAFLDVGQGDSVYMEIGKECMMMDSGSSNVKNVGRYRVIPFLKHRGVNRLNRIVISHPDDDHVNAVIEMIEEGYPAIDEIVVGYNMASNEKVLTAASQAGIKVRRVAAGEVLDSNADITVLSPKREQTYTSVNSGSVVLEVAYNDFTMLLTGDSDIEAENIYADELSGKSFSVLKCAHHGSKYSTSAGLLLRVRPVLTVISCSKYNTYGHPAPALLERLEQAKSNVFTTPDCGMVSVEYSIGGPLRAEGYLGLNPKFKDTVSNKVVEK